jgi:hypothetical protein
LEPALPDVPLLPYTTGCIPVEVCKPELLVTATVPFNDKSQLEDLFSIFAVTQSGEFETVVSAE